MNPKPRDLEGGREGGRGGSVYFRGKGCVGVSGEAEGRRDGGGGREGGRRRKRDVPSGDGVLHDHGVDNLPKEGEVLA